MGVEIQMALFRGVLNDLSALKATGFLSGGRATIDHGRRTQLLSEEVVLVE